MDKVNIDWKSFKDWLLLGFIAGVATVALSTLGAISTNLAELNTKLAVVIKDQSNFVESIKDHESRIRELEKWKH